MDNLLNSLFNYVLALEENVAGLSIIETVSDNSCVEDDGVVIEINELVVTFENGVMLKKQTERDHIAQINDEVCSECWITYEVLAQPKGVNVVPNRKNFTNHCQEVFWLKMNKVQAA